MAKIIRKVQKVFGSAAGVDEISQFGSLANSTPTFTTDPAVIQALSQYLSGWFEAAIGPNSPTIEDVNALCYLFAYQLSYLMQAGVPEWDASTTYYIGSLAQDSSGLVYVSLTDNNLNQAFSVSGQWAQFSGRSLNTPPSLGVTIPVGQTLMNPNLTIPTSSTYTVNGSLYSVNKMVVSGTLITNGDSRVI